MMHMYYMYKHRHGHKIRHERQDYVSNAMTDSQNE